MKDKLLIIGASGHGKVVADIASKMNKWEKIEFLDDNENTRFQMGIEVVGKSNAANKYISEYDIFIGIGKNVTRENFLERLEAAGATIPILIHPNSVIAKNVELGLGTVVMAGAVINCCTKIGRGCIVNTGVTIDHDNVIEDYVHISPGAHIAGTVKIGKGTWLGIGSVVSNNITIVSNCIIGAGAVVVMDITEHGTYVGIPAKKIK